MHAECTVLQCLEAETYFPICLILQTITFQFYDEILLHMGFIMKALNYRVQFGEFPLHYFQLMFCQCTYIVFYLIL